MDTSKENENWFDALSLWNEVVNWSHYKTSDYRLKIKINALLVVLWSEKDWLKNKYPSKTKKIESFVNNSQYIKIVADLANTLKHKVLTRNTRCGAKFTGYYGKVFLNKGISRRLRYISIRSGQHYEIMQVLRGALDEYELLKEKLETSAL